MTLTQEEYVKRWEAISTEKKAVLSRVNQLLGNPSDALVGLLLELATVSDGEYMAIYSKAWNDCYTDLKGGTKFPCTDDCPLDSVGDCMKHD